mgnify:CR=1 FL=1
MGCDSNCSKCSQKCDVKSLRQKPHYLKRIKKVIGVVSGKGGNTLLNRARKVLYKEFPEMARTTLHMPDDKTRRVGQSIAAASLPIINK